MQIGNCSNPFPSLRVPGCPRLFLPPKNRLWRKPWDCVATEWNPDILESWSEDKIDEIEKIDLRQSIILDNVVDKLNRLDDKLDKEIGGN